MQISFKNKNILIGGATGGIGYDIAKRFAQEDANITLLAINHNKLKAIAKELNETGEGSVFYYSIDFEDITKLQTMMKEINKTVNFDIIINNVGGPLPKSFSNICIEELTKQFNKQFLSFFTIVNESIENMKINKSGRIINIIGTSIKSTIEELGLSTPKSSINYWSKTLSEEVGRFGITVNNVLPGPTDTKELKRLVDYYSKKKKISKELFIKNLTNDIALQRIAKTEDISHVVLFLASQYSSYITGTNIAVDGGYTKCLY